MATQYTLDVSLAGTASDAAIQSVLSYLNPSIGAMSSAALQEFQQQLEALTPSGAGTVNLTSAAVDPNSTDATPLFDLGVTGGPNEEISAGAGFDKIIGASGDTLDGSNVATRRRQSERRRGAEVLYGGAGSDTLNGGSGSDTLYGGTGDDTLTGSSSRSGHALIYGGSGDDFDQDRRRLGHRLRRQRR